MTDPDLDELERLESEATPGPWEAQDCSAHVVDSTLESYWVEVNAPTGTILELEQSDFADEQDQLRRDARLMAALRNAAPWLIARAREAERLRLVTEQMIKRGNEYADELLAVCAERDALAAEVERLRAQSSSWESRAKHEIAGADALARRVEELEGRLRSASTWLADILDDAESGRNDGVLSGPDGRATLGDLIDGHRAVLAGKGQADGE